MAIRFYTFQIVIEKEPDGDGYSAYSPSLPGCFRRGKTVEEAKRGVYEAIERQVRSLLVRRRPIVPSARLIHVEELTIAVPE